MTTMTMMTIDSPLGQLRLVERHAELAGLYLPGQAAPDASPGMTPLLGRVATQLAAYFAGERRAFELPIAPRGTGFQERVWHALTTIGYGETWSYGAGGGPRRAVGRLAGGRRDRPAGR